MMLAFELTESIEEFSKAVYSCERAPKFKHVFFIKLSNDSPLARHCALAKGLSHTGRPKRSYCVNVFSKKVVAMCFSSKCKKRQDGKAVIQDAYESDTSDEDSSDDDAQTN